MSWNNIRKKRAGEKLKEKERVRLEESLSFQNECNLFFMQHESYLNKLVTAINLEVELRAFIY